MNALANIDMNAMARINGPDQLMMLGVWTLVLGLWIRSILRIALEWAILFALAVNIVVFVFLLADGSSNWFVRHPEAWNSGSGNIQVLVFVICSYVATNLGIALLLKVYRAAVMEKATPQERSMGLAGIRAWLGPMNVMAVVVLSVAASVAWDWNFFAVFLAGLCLLMIYPLIGSVVQQSASPGSPSTQAAPEERQRVLALVESGKISAEDGAELLTALAQSQAAGIDSAVKISGPRRLMILGAIVLLIGFFLPWFSQNWSGPMTAMVNDMQRAMPQFPMQSAPGAVSMSNNAPIQIPGVTMANVLILRGGDVRNGLGWIALAAGAIAAGLPFFWWERAGDSRPIRNVTFVALGVGTISLLYLLSNSFNAVTSIEPGFVVAIAGFILLWIGGVREYVAIHPRVRASLVAA